MLRFAFFLFYTICLQALVSPILFGQIMHRSGDKNWRDTVNTLDKIDPRPLVFTNINRISYFYDKERIEKLRALVKKDNLMGAYDALHRYVCRFGVRNFHKDWKMLITLARYAEKLGYKQKAAKLYTLVLKHNRIGPKTVDMRMYPELYQYDTLLRQSKKNYLPVEYYFNYANPYAKIDQLDVPESIYTNMGDSVNAKSGDYGPALTYNDLFMIFTSQRNTKRNGLLLKENEDLFITRKADSLYITESAQGAKIDTIPWTRAKPLKGQINTEYNEGSPRISKNGKKIYFARCGAPRGYGNCDLYVACLQKDGTWGKAYNLGLGVNTQSWESHPSLSHSEDTLFFASDRMGGFGLSDIYCARKIGYFITPEKDTIFKWSRAYNLGPTINTRYNEVSPFYHPIFPVLYFSSDGQIVNFGGYDIYKTKLDLGLWIEPQNIGPLINYKKDEYYFTIDSKVRNIYYAKTVKVKRMDFDAGDTLVREVLSMHTASLPMEAQPEAVAVFKGAIKDSITGKGFEGIVSIVDLDEGVEVAPKYLNADGSYRFDLIRNRNYLVIITGEEFFRVEKQFLLKGDTTMNISTPNIKFKKWKFEALEFAEGRSEITDLMKPDLEKLVMFLADHPNLGLKISGHTNASGSAEGNKRLSQKRADAIKQYIISRGKFETQRIEAIGYGNEKPVTDKEESDDHRKLNRRVEFEIVKQD